jgi:1,4-dihydroxy-2-naphthoate octaprenyltransferase
LIWPKKFPIVMGTHAWFTLLLVSGLLPFGVGTLLAGASGFPIRKAIFGLGLAATACLMLAALAGREAYAFKVGRWPSLENQPPGRWDRLAYIFLGSAGLLGLILQFVLGTGDMTIPLGGVGALAGYFCFAPPLQWYKRGWFETGGALCFGLLPVLTAYYLQCGHLISEILVYGLPLSFAAFNIFLVHGIPDAVRKSQPARFSLAERLLPPATGLVFTIINILTILCLVFYLLFPAGALPARWILWCLLILALVNQELVKRRAFYDECRIKLVCRLTLVLHLGMGLIFAWALWQRL